MKRRIELLSTGQRTVCIIGFAAALQAIGRTVELWGRGPTDGGWFGYAPNTRVVFGPSVPFLLRHGWLDLVWRLVLIGTWAAGSLYLLAVRRDDVAGASERADEG